MKNDKNIQQLDMFQIICLPNDQIFHRYWLMMNLTMKSYRKFTIIQYGFVRSWSENQMIWRLFLVQAGTFRIYTHTKYINYYWHNIYYRKRSSLPPATSPNPTNLQSPAKKTRSDGEETFLKLQSRVQELLSIPGKDRSDEERKEYNRLRNKYSKDKKTYSYLLEDHSSATGAQRKAASRARMTDEQREDERAADRRRKAQPEAQAATR